VNIVVNNYVPVTRKKQLGGKQYLPPEGICGRSEKFMRYVTLLNGLKAESNNSY
jgi:hypothetical protein